MTGSLGLACKRVNLNELGLPLRVIEIIQCTRAPSTHSLCNGKWYLRDGVRLEPFVSEFCSGYITLPAGFAGI